MGESPSRDGNNGQTTHDATVRFAGIDCQVLSFRSPTNCREIRRRRCVLPEGRRPAIMFSPYTRRVIDETH